MPTIDQLRTELLSGPLAGELSRYITGTYPNGSTGCPANDQLVADRLNLKEIDGTKRVPLADVKRHALENGYWLSIKSAAVSHANAQVQGAAIAALDYVNDLRFETIDLALPATQTMLGALVAGNVISQSQADALLAMAATKISRAEQLWGSGTRITAEDVGSAR